MPLVDGGRLVWCNDGLLNGMGKPKKLALLLLCL
jgi:hypothetical protein